MPLIIVKPTLQKEYSPSRYLGEKQITFVGWCRALDKTEYRNGILSRLRKASAMSLSPVRGLCSIDLPAELG